MHRRTFIRIAANVKGKDKDSVGICFEEIQLVFAIQKNEGGKATSRVCLEMNNKTSIMLGLEYETEDDFFRVVEEQMKVARRAGTGDSEQ